MNVVLAATTHIKGPHIDWASLAPFVALTVGSLVALLLGLIRAEFVRERIVPIVTLLALGVTIALEIARFDHPRTIISGALRVDDLALVLDLLFATAAIATVLLAWRARAAHESGHGEFFSLLLFSVLGMAVLVSAQNTISLFIGFELLSIPLYVLCASEFRREASLESGLKYLVIGSVGSATLVYGLAMVYGATGSTDFSGIARAISGGSLAGGVLGDPLLLTGFALVLAGFAFKASVAPFHQWTPDVYEGAPTAVTAFMATATKAAALGVFIRFFDVAGIAEQNDWAPAIATIAAITIIVGNVGALGQSSLKRMLGYSGVAQAGYMLGGVVVGTQLGVQATVLYLIVYLFMNLAAFAVIVAQEDELYGSDGSDPDYRPGGDDISSIAGLGARRPWLAWPMTIAMLSLAGIPATVGFIGKFQLIHALVNGDYTWLAVVLVIGSMISLGYYLRVIAVMWMRPRSLPSAAASAGVGSPAMAGAGAGGGTLPPIAGASGEAEPGAVPSTAGATSSDGGGWPASADSAPRPEVVLVAVVFGAASVFFGIFPSPLFNLVAHAGHALSGLF